LVQKQFIQQRGLTETKEGLTNDIREVNKRLGDEMAPIALGDGPRVVDETRKNPIDEDREVEASTFLIDDQVDDDFYQ
jgi:hypothetical protein